MSTSLRLRQHVLGPRRGLLSLSAMTLVLATLTLVGGTADFAQARKGAHTIAGSVQAGASRVGGEPSTNDASPPAPSFAVGLRTLHLVDWTRTIRLPDGRSEPRRLLTYVRYPAVANTGALDVRDAPPETVNGPYPLIVFAHGFATTPKPYARLLRSWASAGFVVASPVFPLTNPAAPGGPRETDVINQPGDLSVVISALLSLSRSGSGPFAGLFSPNKIAVAGHSDGGETALAVAYSRRFRDHRVSAAVILSGAEERGVGGYSFSRGGPALLAAQGTADTLNEPRYSEAYFAQARRPKFLLRLLGAGHLSPYSYEEPQLGVVERVSVAFFDAYLRHGPSLVSRLSMLGNIAGTAQLLSAP